jgi:hypothetical protein
MPGFFLERVDALGIDLGHCVTNSRLSILAVQDPEVARIYWDGLANRSVLSEADLRRFDPLISLFVGGGESGVPVRA